MNPLNAYRERLQAALAPWRARFEALQQREQIVLAAGAAVVALALLYLAIWEPAALVRAHRQRDLAAARTLASRLEVIGAQARLARPPQALVAMAADASLLAMVDQAAKDGTLNKPPARMQPDGDTQVRVWFEDVQFDVLLRWMYGLQTRYGIRVQDVAVERRPTAGVVNARLSLERPR